ncbi:hypothetical protein [Metabacillus schmidteae]|nr:hypothetical protein [Metabacillus schmidteae]
MDRTEIRQIVLTFKEQIQTALDGENQADEIKNAVREMLTSLNIQQP